jgi:Flp pilus assembly protein TadD
VTGVIRPAALVLAVALLSGCATLEGYRHFRLGNAALDRGDLARAVAELELAATLAPERSEIMNHLGIAYAAAGRSGDALSAFERAVSLDCDNREAAANLAAARAGAPVAEAR